MDNQFILRRANLSDIDALSQLSERTFRETFVEDFAIPYPEKDLQDYFNSATTPEWFAAKINHPKAAVWIIQDKINDEFVAYAVASPMLVDDIPHPDACSNEDGALNRLYVRRDRRSHGLGRQLMEVILPWCKETFAARPVWLTTFSENYKAQKFYSHYNFHKDGECYYPVGQWQDLECIMKRKPDTD